MDNVVTLADLKRRLERLEAQRLCMRVPDPLWEAMKKRAKKAPERIDDALERELNRYANCCIFR